MTLSLIALAGAGLFVRSLDAARKVDPGFDPSRMLALSFDVGLQGHDQPRGKRFFSQVADRIEGLPQVLSASVALAGPFQGGMGRSVLLEGSENERTFVVSPSDPVAFGVTLAALLLVGAAAIFIPARRGAGLDPLQALRHE